MTSPVSVEEVVRIAKGLSAGEREAVLLWEAADFASASRERQRELIRALGREGVRPLIAKGIATKPNYSRGIQSILTPLGLAVRAHLLARTPSGDGHVG